MSKMQDRRQQQKRLARLRIISEMVLRHYTVRQMREEVMRRLDLPTYSLSTVHADIELALKELREERLDNTEAALVIELQRIDDTCRELWAQWEKSKEDYVRIEKRRRGVPAYGDASGAKSKTTHIETKENNVVGLGNVAYIAEIRAQLQERRKLLGLYSAEKKEISGELTFASLLMESSMLDEAEAQSTVFD